MGKKRFAHDPLLYIHQPKIRTPEAKMQTNYITTRETKKTPTNANENPPVTPVPKNPIKKNAFHQQLNHQKDTTTAPNKDELAQNKVVDGEEKNSEVPEEDKSVKFIDMTLDEKVAYFLDEPSFAPRMKCEIKTADKYYRGILTDRKGDDVFIRTGKRSTSTKISMADIINIRMLGF